MPIEGFCGFLLGVWDGNMIRYAVADFVVPMAMFGAMCFVTAKAEDKTLNPFALVLSQVVIITVGDRLIHLLISRNAVRELVALLLQISRRDLLVMATLCFLYVVAGRLLLRISPRFRQWADGVFSMGPRRNRATWDPYSRALLLRRRSSVSPNPTHALYPSPLCIPS